MKIFEIFDEFGNFLGYGEEVPETPWGCAAGLFMILVFIALTPVILIILGIKHLSASSKEMDKGNKKDASLHNFVALCAVFWVVWVVVIWLLFEKFGPW